MGQGMDWQDEGVVLAARRFGESALVASALTRAHGRFAGLVRGGAGRRGRPLWQPGNRLLLTWRARLPDQLGAFSAEPVDLLAARLMDDAERLAGLASALALVESGLAERDPHPDLYDELGALLGRMASGEPWLERYVGFELTLLAEIGFGLDLSRCAVTGAREDLIYVSPASGRAVSAAGAGHYAPRLLPLPPFLLGRAAADSGQIVDALRLTGAFLRRHLFDATDRPVPQARERLLARLSRGLNW
jgi:DNA repair protein RecO (recombination protein O)